MDVNLMPREELLQKIKNDLSYYQARPDGSWDRLKVALCHIKLENYALAHENCLAALENCSFNNEPGYRIFIATSEIEKLLELFIFAGQPQSFLPNLISEVEAYKMDKRGNSLVAHYAYAMLAFLKDEDEKAMLHIAPLIKYPKVKDMFAIGRIIQAIGQNDQNLFDQTFDSLLIAHRGRAIFGGLRETPEKYLSIAAMCLAKLARDRGFKVGVECEYFSQSYLDFLGENNS